MLPLLLILAAVLHPQAPAPAPASEPAPDPLAVALAAAVDAPTPTERRKAADALLARPGVSVAQWQKTCAAFGTFAPREPGPEQHQVELRVLGQVESTELFLYVPKNCEPQKPAPLLLWGHGAGGTGAREYLLWQEVADRLGMYVLAPTEAGKQQGWDFSPRARAAQLAALRWARRQVNVDENAIFVGGASRGGHMTWDLALRWPDLWAGMLPCIGGPRLVGQDNLRYLENVVRLPVRDLQGSQDDALLLQNLHLAFDRLHAMQAREKVDNACAQLIEFADKGHDFDAGAVDWPAFFAARRPPVPGVVVRLAADPGEARAAWAEILGFEPGIAVDVQPEADPGTWDRLDEAGRRALVLDKWVDRTARLRVAMLRPGQFVAVSRGVRRFRLWFTPAMLGPDGAVEVQWLGKTYRKKIAPSAAVLLREFVERFDRAFLPVGELVVP